MARVEEGHRKRAGTARSGAGLGLGGGVVIQGLVS